MYIQIDKLMDGWTNRQKYKLTEKHRWTAGHMDGWADNWIDRWIIEWRNKHTVRQKEGWMKGQQDTKKNIWIYEQIIGQMDERMDR